MTTTASNSTANNIAYFLHCGFSLRQLNSTSLYAVVMCNYLNCLPRPLTRGCGNQLLLTLLSSVFLYTAVELCKQILLHNTLIIPSLQSYLAVVLKQQKHH